MPTFNPGDYQAALEKSQFAETKLQQASSEAQSQQIEAQQFALNTQIDYKKKQKEASSIFSKWKTGSGLLSGLLTVAMGITNPFAAAAIAATIAGAGTKYGKDKAMGKLSGKWLKGQTADTGEEFDSQVIKNALLSGITAGVTTHMAGAKAAKGAEATKATGKAATPTTAGTYGGNIDLKDAKDYMAEMGFTEKQLVEDTASTHLQQGGLRTGQLSPEEIAHFKAKGINMPDPSSTTLTQKLGGAPDPLATSRGVKEAWQPVFGSGLKGSQIPGQMARNLKTGVGAWGDQATSMMDNITGPGSPGMGFSPKVQLLSHYLGFGGKKVI